MKRIVQTTLGKQDAGAGLVDFLTARFTYHAREAWLELISQERLLLNGVPADAKAILAAGDLLEYRYEPAPEPPVDVRFQVIHEGDGFLIIDKPADLPCHPGGRYFENTLWALLKGAGHDELHFVNRLDRETSGVMVVATDKTAAKICRRQLELGRVRKVYDVFVEGEFPQTLDCDGWLFRSGGSLVAKRLSFVPYSDLAGGPDGGKRAFTGFRLLERGMDGISRLQAVPRTGRLHQIRATLHGVGFPVVGDKLYGVDEALFLRFRDGTFSLEDKRRLRLGRQALHASEITFDDPAGKERLTFRVPLPTDLAALLEAKSHEGDLEPQTE